MMSHGAARERGPLLWGQAAGLLALCVLGAAGWIVMEAVPGGLPSMTGRAVRLGVVGAGAGLWSFRREGGSWRAAGLWRVAAAGVCLIGVPEVMLQVAREGVGEASAVVLSAVAPILVVVFAAFGEEGRTLWGECLFVWRAWRG